MTHCYPPTFPTCFWEVLEPTSSTTKTNSGWVGKYFVFPALSSSFSVMIPSSVTSRSDSNSATSPTSKPSSSAEQPDM
jgi:hypothetical protein